MPTRRAQPTLATAGLQQGNGADNGSLLDTLFELGEGEHETRDLQTHCDRYQGRIPPTLMPIGCDAGGSCWNGQLSSDSGRGDHV